MKRNIGKQKSTSKEKFWQQHIREYKDSSLNLKRYCKEHDLALSTFNY